MHLLGAEAVSIAYQGRAVLDGIRLGIDSGDRIGIVGRNGDGKTTLLDVLAGLRAPDSGRVTHRGGIDVAVLPQAGLPRPHPDRPGTARGEMGSTVGAAIVGDMPEHEWAAKPRIREILAGLVADLDWEAPLRELSGGQRRRVALAAVLAGEHDVLFLDEPTNHLDLEAIAWLADHLRRRWPVGSGALAVVTHDRWFLDAVCTTTWEVHGGRVEPFEGGYAAYVLARVERDRQAAAAETRRRNVMRKELAWLRRGAPARTSKPRFRLDTAAELIEAEPPPRDSIELTRLATARLGRDVIDLVDVDAAYDDGPPVLRDVTWLIGPGERSGILGANGAGKSTLLAVVAGRLGPTAGRVKIGKTVKLATLTQETTDLAAAPEATADDLIAQRKREYAAGQSLGWTGGGRDGATARSGDEFTPGHILERLGFGAEHMRTPVGRLSGGQRRRLQLALVLMDEPNVLILDEPSNDLDTDMLAAMEDLLDSWPGTLLVVTHDRYLMERVTDQQYAIVGGQLRMMPGGVEEYLQLADAGQGAPPKKVSALGKGTNGPQGTGGGLGAGGGRCAGDGAGAGSAQARATRKLLATVERKLAKVNARIGSVNATMAAHDPSDFAGLVALNDELLALKAEAAALEERWLDAAESAERRMRCPQLTPPATDGQTGPADGRR
ncbi:MAG: ATP-binding cassette domain-containing protein [Bifidobacteriaceae bacterium]|jgi:ATPase subunit of ABC transporter with duplicated ATPase domains|nr:ATP-binding cassette domain-containing protein [Bifidobacteriaceae bacterium]